MAVSFLKKIIAGFLARRGQRLAPIDFHALGPNRFFDEIYQREYGSNAHGFLNIGAGRFRHPRWTNLDLRDEYANRGWIGGDINYDLLSLEPIPVGDGELHCVYTSHVIEHLTDEAVVFLFSEVRRMLRPSGSFRIVCPDIDIAIGAYRRKDHRFFSQIFSEQINDVATGLVRYCATQLINPENPANLLGTDLDARLANADDIHAELDTLCKLCNLDIQRRTPNDHINWFNEERLKRMLEDAGFVSVTASRAGQSRVPIFRDTRYFDTTLPYMSLYVDALAPAK